MIKERKNKPINYGLEILRTILSFYVVKLHCFHDSTIRNKILYYIIIKNRNIHVPSFFIMSFYFNYNCLKSRNPKRNYDRFKRLLIPYILWPIIAFIFNIIFRKYMSIDLKFTFKQLIIQIIIGRGIINTLWFQFDLIFFTYLFLLVIYIFKNSYLFILQLLMIISYFQQYSKYNYYLFFFLLGKFTYSIARLNPCFPFTVTGFTFAFFNTINYLNKNYKYKAIIFSIVIFIFVDNFDVLTFPFGLDAYFGIKLNVLSICLIFIFSLLSFNSIKNRYIKNFIMHITKYTAGVYYLHIPVYEYSKNYLFQVKKGTFIGVFFI